MGQSTRMRALAVIAVWLLVSASAFAQGAATVFIQETEPVTPPFGALWYQLSTDTLKLVESTTPLTWGALAAGAGDMLKSENLSGLVNYTTARSNLGLGTLATQSGTFSGTSSGTNTGDNSVNTLYSGLVSNATHTGDATGATALTVVKIQGKDFPALGAGDDQKYPKYVSASNAFVMTAIAGGGDMVLADPQTVTGAKTFGDTKFLLRNAANTFNGSFVNANTADRIYTLKDAAGTLAFTSDITGTNSGTNTGDQASIVGITGTLAQFNTAVTDADFASGGGTASGTNTGDQTTVSGNAGSATVLQTARAINGVNFDGSAPITVTAAGSTLSDNVPVSKLNSGTGATSSTFWRGDGTWVAPAGGSNYRTLVTLGGDVTDSAGANTYADCTGLSFAVTAGTRYRFYAVIYYTAGTPATTGSGWSINGPTATNMAYKSTYTLSATTTTTNYAVAYDIPAASNAATILAGGIAILEGTVLPSANGTIIVRFMTEVNAVAVVCKAGSTIEIW